MVASSVSRDQTVELQQAQTYGYDALQLGNEDAFIVFEPFSFIATHFVDIDSTFNIKDLFKLSPTRVLYEPKYIDFMGIKLN